jgi:hypothetical protein
MHGEHALPLAPHCELEVPGSQLLPSQQPEQLLLQSLAMQLPFEQASPLPQA